MKLAFVIQRYGEEISGGAELHCRLIAEHFTARGDEVHIYTTCALDYMTWADHYPAGIQMLNGVTVHRFRVDAPRDVKHFNRLSEQVYGKQGGIVKEEEWMRAQGPYSSELFEAISKDKAQYEWMLFYNYLYCTTYFGLPSAKEKAILAPMAHDEPPIYFEIFKKIFSGARALMYNTEEERDFIRTQFVVDKIPSRVVGMWAPEPIEVEPDEAFYKKAGSRNFIVYIGRMDRSKGCDALIQYFLEYKKQFPSDVKLLLMGRGDMQIPRHPDVVAWGYATETEKWQALRGALASVIPSMYESLSISLLESFAVARPVIVNGYCEVTKGHCIKSNGGLWYESTEEFAEALEYLRKTPLKADTLGRNGKAYVAQNYSWAKVLQKYDSVFAELAR